jgi:G:T/U-mismatch repair DNA glycosylase
MKSTQSMTVTTTKLKRKAETMANNVPDNTQTNIPLSVDDAADALLARWTDADENQPSESDVPEAADTEPTPETNGSGLVDEQDTEVELDDDQDLEGPEDELDEDDYEDDDDQEEDTEEEAEEARKLSNDDLVSVTVDGETHQVPAKKLARLYGQEASLTRKSQELATQRKAAEEAVGKTSAVMQRMLEQAEQAYKPYADVDMLIASKTMSDSDFTQLRKEAQQAEDQLKFLREEADTYYSSMRSEQDKLLQEQAQTAVKVLQDAVPEWSNELYNDIRTYAVAQGLPEEQVNMIVDPNSIMILNKARLYDQGKRVASVKRKKASTKKVMRSQKAPPSNKQLRTEKLAKSRAKLHERGSDIDDIADALMARWEE